MKAEWKNGKQIKQILLNGQRPVAIGLNRNGFAFQGEYKNHSFSFGQTYPVGTAMRSYAIPFSQRLADVDDGILELPFEQGQSCVWSNYTGTDQSISIIITPLSVNVNGKALTINTDSTPYIGFMKQNRIKTTLWQNHYYDFAVMFRGGTCFVIDGPDQLATAVNDVSIVADKNYRATLSIYNMKVRLVVEELDNKGKRIGRQVHKFSKLAIGYYTAMFCSSHLQSIEDDGNLNETLFTSGQTILNTPLLSFQNTYPFANDYMQDNVQLIPYDNGGAEQLESTLHNDWNTHEQWGVVRDNRGNVASIPANPIINPYDKKFDPANPTFYQCNCFARNCVRPPMVMSATVDLRNINDIILPYDLFTYGELALMKSNSERAYTLFITQGMDAWGLHQPQNFKVYGFTGPYELYQLKDYQYLHISLNRTYIDRLYVYTGFSVSSTSGSKMLIVTDTNFGSTRSLPSWFYDFYRTDESGKRYLDNDAMLNALWERMTNIAWLVQRYVDYGNEIITVTWEGQELGSGTYWALENILDDYESQLEEITRRWNNASERLNQAERDLNNYDADVERAANLVRNRMRDYNSAVQNWNNASNSFDSALESFISRYSNQFQSATGYRLTMYSNVYTYSFSDSEGLIKESAYNDIIGGMTVNGSAGNDYDKMLFNLQSTLLYNRDDYNPGVHMDAAQYRTAHSAASTLYSAYNNYQSKLDDLQSAYSDWLNLVKGYDTLVKEYNDADEAFAEVDREWRSMDATVAALQNALAPYETQMSRLKKNVDDANNALEDDIDGYNSAVKYNSYDRYINRQKQMLVNGISVKDQDTLSLVQLDSSLYAFQNGVQIGNSTSAPSDVLHEVIFCNNAMTFNNIVYDELICDDESVWNRESDLVQTTSSSAQPTYEFTDDYEIHKTASDYTKIVNNSPMKMNKVSFRLGDDLSKEIYVSCGSYSENPAYRSDKRLDSSSYGFSYKFVNGYCYYYIGTSTSSSTAISSSTGYIKPNSKIDIIFYLTSSNYLYSYVYVDGVRRYYYSSSSTYNRYTSGEFMSALCIYSADGKVSYYNNVSIMHNGRAEYNNTTDLCKNYSQGEISLVDFRMNRKTNTPLTRGVLPVDSNGNVTALSGDPASLKLNKWQANTGDSNYPAYVEFMPQSITDGKLGYGDAIDLSKVKTVDMAITIDSAKATPLFGFVGGDYQNQDSFVVGVQPQYDYSSAGYLGRTLVDVPNDDKKYFVPLKVRYIRDYINGSTENTYGHWQEISAYAKDINGKSIDLSNIAINPAVKATFYSIDTSEKTINPNTAEGIGKVIASGGTKNSTNLQNAVVRSLFDGINSTYVANLPIEYQKFDNSASREGRTLRINLSGYASRLTVGTTLYCCFKSKYILSWMDFNDITIDEQSIDKYECYWSMTYISNNEYPYMYCVSIKIHSDHLYLRSGYTGFRFLDLNYADDIPVDDFGTTDTNNLVNTADIQCYCATTDASQPESFIDFPTSGLKCCQVDLGDVYDVTMLNIAHYYRDGRTYHNTRTEVSVDGKIWFSLFDSSRSDLGMSEYVEPSSGHNVPTQLGWSIGDVVGIKLIRNEEGNFNIVYYDDTFYGVGVMPNTVYGLDGNMVLVPCIAFEQSGKYALNPRLKIEYLDNTRVDIDLNDKIHIKNN